MARTSNLEKARIKLDQLLVNHDGRLTPFFAVGYLNQVTEEFNLSVEKSLELKSFKYSRQTEEEIGPKTGLSPQSVAVDLKEDREQSEVETPLTADDRFKALEARCQNLEDVISRLAVNTGNANWLREYGIERWTPEKKHMSKKYA